MSIKKIYQSFLRFLGNHLLYYVLMMIIKTYKINIRNQENLSDILDKGRNCIIAFWHGTMLAPWYLMRNKRMLGLISMSKDGEVLARILRQWKYHVTRGSSSKGGEIALGIMVDYARFEGSVCITPDGPRGPRHIFKAGALIAAKKSGVPLVLVGVGYKKKLQMNSWDRFEFPLPFTEVNIVFSESIYIDKSLSYDETSKKIEEAEQTLKTIQEEAGRFSN